jgi:integrase
MSKYVIPIRDKRKIEAIKKNLSPRDRMMFVIGINSALRISDLLTLAVGDVRERENGKLKTRISLKEGKTGKEKRFPLNQSILNELKSYLQVDWAETRPLFKSRKGHGSIKRDQAHDILSKAGKRVGLSNIGTHSMRKTFAYHVYQQSKRNLGLVQKLLNHSSSADTLRYIGIEEDDMDSAYLRLNL